MNMSPLTLNTALKRMKKIEVVAAVIFSRCGKKIFLAKRPDKSHQGGLWEFPGGKKEEGESAYQALARELEEELAIKVRTADSLVKINHDYGDKLIELDVYKVTAFEGEPFGAEGQKTQWVELADINQYKFPAANQAIIDALIGSEQSL